MALYRTISMGFWTDSKVLDEFTPEDKYFYLYLFTNPHTNLAGCYEISLKQMVVETGYSKESIESLISRFESVHNVVKYSAATKELLIINWHKYHWTSSEKYRKPLLKEIQSIKEKSFKDYLQGIFDGNTGIYPIDTKCIDTPNTISISNTNTISNTKRKKSERNIIPPTRDMVEAYISEQGYNVNADAFMDYYNSNGWHVGRNKMKDWQAAVRTWEKRNTPKEQDAFEIAKERFLRG